MKIIVSSRYLAKRLSKLDIYNQNVEQIVTTESGIVFIGKLHSVSVNCEVSTDDERFNQSDVRYDFLHEHLTKLPEMPIILEFSDNSLTMQITY